MDTYALWNGYTQADVADRYFRSDGLQVRFEKRSMSEKGGVLDVGHVLHLEQTVSRTCAASARIGPMTRARFCNSAPTADSAPCKLYDYNGKGANLPILARFGQQVPRVRV